MKSQALTDALATCERQLEGEQNALFTLQSIGHADGFDARFARTELARLTALRARLINRINNN